MKLSRRYRMLGSSQNPDKISLTIKSIGLALVPVVIGVCGYYNVAVVETDLIQLINSIATIASAVGVIYGVARKFKK